MLAPSVAAFASEQEVYDRLGRLLGEVLAQPELAAHFQRADAVVQYRLAAPDARLTLDLRADGVPRLELGACTLEPDVVLAMDADTAHRLFLGGVNFVVAVARGDVSVVRGPLAKVIKLVALVKPLCARYRAQCEADGHADPVPA